MLTEDKLTDHALISDHLQDLSDLQTPVALEVDGRTISRCRLLYQQTPNIEFYARAPVGTYPTTGTLSVVYTAQDAPFLFNSEIVSCRQEEAKFVELRLQPPEVIARSNRRTYFRVKPAADQPVLVSIKISERPVIHTRAEDISGGGLGFVIHRTFDFLTAETRFPLTVVIPPFKKIHTDALLRGVSRTADAVCLGAEFVDIPERDRNTIIGYSVRRELELRRNPESPNQLKGARLAIIDEKENFGLFTFLETTCAVKKINIREHALRDKLKAAPFPELIVLNLDHPEADDWYRFIAASAPLGKLPLVLLSTEEHWAHPERRAARFLTIPFKAKGLLVAVQQEIAWLRRIREAEKWKHPTRTTTHLLLLDRAQRFNGPGISLLKNLGYGASVIATEKNILARINEEGPDAIILYADDPTIALSICRLLQMNKKLKWVPRILIADNDHPFRTAVSEGLASASLRYAPEPEDMVAQIKELLPA